MSSTKRLAYLIHPYTTYGDAAANEAAQVGLCDDTLKRWGGDLLPVSPILTFGRVYSHEPEHHDLAMAACLRLLDACNEVHVHGEWRKSAGCCQEVAHALTQGKLIRFFDAERDTVPRQPKLSYQHFHADPTVTTVLNPDHPVRVNAMLTEQLAECLRALGIRVVVSPVGNSPAHWWSFPSTAATSMVAEAISEGLDALTLLRVQRVTTDAGQQVEVSWSALEPKPISNVRCAGMNRHELGQVLLYVSDFLLSEPQP